MDIPLQMESKIIFDDIGGTEFKRLISNTIDDSLDKLSKYVASAYQKLKKRKTLEVELRLQHLGFTEYQRIVNWFNENNSRFTTIEHNRTTDYFDESSYRYTINEEGKILSIIKKEKIQNVDIKELDVRLSVNLENSYKIDPELTIEDVKEQSSYFRNKNRTSYILEGMIRVDITEVSYEERRKTKYNYECEIEFTSISNSGEIDDTSRKLAKEMVFVLMINRQNSERIYTQDKLRDMIVSLNNMLGEPPNREGLSYKFLAPARNLKYPDLVYGGIIGGKVKYNVTQKVDGIRKFFLVYGGGVWLVYPPNDFNLITTFTNSSIPEFMIDGEDVPTSNRSKTCDIKSNHMYIPFDTVLVSGSNSIQSKPHNIRMEAAVKYLDFMNRILPKDIGISILYKEFKELGDTFESMSKAVIDTYSLRDSMCYHTDGMIFTPINANYNTGTEKQKIQDRVLTKFPDICKFKEWDKLTIDLYIDVEKKIGYGRGINNEQTPFIGSFRNSFDSKINIDWEAEFFKTLTVNGIVEFKPKKDGDIYLLTPLKARPDKIQSNRTDYAGAIWDDINDPLDIKTFKGETFRLLRHSFNRIKKDLYSEISNDSDIFEIGTGNGGQMYRWTKLNKVFGVEPDQDHINEMNKRLDNYDKNNKDKPLGPKVNVIKAGGEETEKIVKGCKKWFGWKEGAKPRPFFIVSMLSLSFFWKNLSTFNGLVSTMQELAKAYRNVGGKEVVFIFMTIRGGPVIRLFSEVQSENNKKSLVLGPCTMSLLPKTGDELTQKLEIHIEDSIVDNQEEYLVSLSDLTKYVPLENLTSTPSNIEKCMSEAERKYSTLFVSGRAKISIKDKNTPVRQIDMEKKEVKVHVPETPNERIDFRYRGRADFLTSRWLNLELYHQSREEKYLSFPDINAKETSAYKLIQFGHSKDREYYALGVLSLDSLGEAMAEAIKGKKNGGVVFSVASLVNAILTCTDIKYQQIKDEIERYSYCSDFYESALRRLVDKTEYPSEEAMNKNKRVREWLPEVEIESLIYSKLIDDKLIKAEEVYYKSSKKGYYIGEVIYTGKYFKETPEKKEGSLAFSFEESKKIKTRKLSDEEKAVVLSLLVDPDEEPEEITRLTRFYKWKGEYKNYTDFNNSFNDDSLHNILLLVDRIDTSSIFYNCRNGELFRYYHMNGKSLPEIRKELTLFGKIDEENNEEEFYSNCLQFSFLSDVYGINIKSFSINKECLGKNNNVGCIADRIYCVAKEEYSFYTTNPGSKNFIHVYYHHYETKNNRDSWSSEDLHNSGPYIRGIYVPLGVVNKDGLIKTLFED